MIVNCDQLQPKVPKQFLNRLACEGVSADTAVEWQLSANEGKTQKGFTAHEVLGIDSVEADGEVGSRPTHKLSIEPSEYVRGIVESQHPEESDEDAEPGKCPF